MHEFSETLNASVITLFNGMSDRKLEYRQIQVAQHYESMYEISCHMGFFDISGKAAGVALLNINRKDIVGLWSGIWGMPASGESEAAEVAKEITNMIVANASAKFAETGQTFRVALPQIIEAGHKIKLSTMKRDNFYYYEFSDGDLRFNWVICSYDVIEFD